MEPMKTIKPPSNEQQPQLFNKEDYSWWATQLSPNALRKLETGWQGVFRRSILALMPAEKLGENFSETNGRPSKELYSMAGLMLIAEFKNLTGEQAAEAYTFDASTQYALNLPRDRQYLSDRSVDNYRKLFREEELAQSVFLEVTTALAGELELDIKRQRLDSTHVLSNMAVLTRQQQLSVCVKRFLVQLEKHHPQSFSALPEELQQRYRPAETRLFGGGKPASKNKLSREEIYQQIGEDMAQLISEFRAHEKIGKMKSYRAVERMFSEHFEPPEESGGKKDKPPKLRPKSEDSEGGSSGTLQNTSDEEAGYDGHKGAGYQAQIAQSLPPENEEGEKEGPGLITGLLPESAAESDSAAVSKMLEQQDDAGLKPEDMSADTAYGSDANVEMSADQGVRLISPVGGSPKKTQTPRHGCSRAEKARKERLEKRRIEQESEEWKRDYAKRSGIEGLNRALDQVTGFKRLRVRGGPAVTMSLYLKAAGWNILTGSKILAHRSRKSRILGKNCSQTVRKMLEITKKSLQKLRLDFFLPSDHDSRSPT